MQVLRDMSVSVAGERVWLSQLITQRRLCLIPTGVEQSIEEASHAVRDSYGELPLLPPAKGPVIGVVGAYIGDLVIISDLETMQSLLGAIRAAWNTSLPEILGEESCQKVTYLRVALEIYQTPWSAVTKLTLH